MDRRTFRIFAAALGLVVVVALAATFLGGSPTPTRPDAPTVDGIVIGVDSAGLNQVSAFTLLSSDGTRWTFGLGSLRNPTQFAPGHLAEHLANSIRIRVWYGGDAGNRVALWLEDAPAT